MAGTLGASPPLSQLLARCAADPLCLRSMARDTTMRQVRSWLKHDDEERHDHGDDQQTQPSSFFVWLWFEFGAARAPPRHLQLNLQALRRNAPRRDGFRIVMLNSSTIGSWVDDLPPEFSRLRHRNTASDVARIALLARYGGLYMDVDVLLATPLKTVASLLENYEHVAYASPGQECSAGRFSSNFIASRPNSSLWRLAWVSLKASMASTCRKLNKAPSKQQAICCYNAKREPLEYCLHQYGVTDLIMRPIAEGLALNQSLSVYCYQGQAGLAPHAGFRPGHLTPLEESCVNIFHLPQMVLGGCRTCVNPTYTSSTAAAAAAQICCSRFGEHDQHLECRNGRGGRALALKFFIRPAYHLFESINGATFAAVGKIEESNLTVAPLYRRALGL